MTLPVDAATLALLLLGLAVAYLLAQLLRIWRSRNADLPPPPPGGWKKGTDWDDEEDDWPQRPGG